MRKMRAVLVILMLFTAVAACKPSGIDWAKPQTETLGCDDYQSIPVSNAVLYNNVWNKAAAKDFASSQCLERKPETDPPIYGWSWSWPNRGRDIFAYPQIKIGTSPWAPLPKTLHELPVKISDLESFTVSHDLDINAAGRHNVATSMWLTHTPEIGQVQNKSVIAAELMVWTYAAKGHLNPAGRKAGMIEHKGRIWSVWIDKSWHDVSGANDNRWIHLTFMAQDNQLSSQFDVVSLLGDALLSDLNLQDLYIADVELGTEIMRGQGLVWVNDFDVKMKSQK